MSKASKKHASEFQDIEAKHEASLNELNSEVPSSYFVSCMLIAIVLFNVRITYDMFVLCSLLVVMYVVFQVKSDVLRKDDELDCLRDAVQTEKVKMDRLKKLLTKYS